MPCPDVELRCPFCRQHVAVSASDGFAYIRSRLVLHMDHCDIRPAGLDEGDIALFATHLADRVMAAGTAVPQATIN